jgi:hypothetical protein
VGKYDRVVVHVHHARLRRRPLSDLVGVVRRRQSGPYIQELPDTRLGDQEAHCPSQERALRTDRSPHIRVRGGDLLGDGPVGCVVVLAVQPEVVNSRHMRSACVEHGTVARWPTVARHLALPFLPHSHGG